MMNCEALAFVAAQLHAAKCVQRYKCSEIAQALKETLCFLFVLFVISVNIRLISVPDLLPKRRLEHTTNWSVIWHNFDVIETSIRRQKREWKERKTIGLSLPKNLTRFSKGKSDTERNALPDSVGPKTRRRSCPPGEKDCLGDAS